MRLAHAILVHAIIFFAIYRSICEFKSWDPRPLVNVYFINHQITSLGNNEKKKGTYYVVTL